MLRVSMRDSQYPSILRAVWDEDLNGIDIYISQTPPKTRMTLADSLDRRHKVYPQYTRYLYGRSVDLSFRKDTADDRFEWKDMNLMQFLPGRETTVAFPERSHSDWRVLQLSEEPECDLNNLSEDRVTFHVDAGSSTLLIQLIDTRMEIDTYHCGEDLAISINDQGELVQIYVRTPEVSRLYRAQAQRAVPRPRKLFGWL